MLPVSISLFQSKLHSLFSSFFPPPLLQYIPGFIFHMEHFANHPARGSLGPNGMFPRLNFCARVIYRCRFSLPCAEHFSCVVKMLYNLQFIQALAALSSKFSPEERQAWSATGALKKVEVKQKPRCEMPEPKLIFSGIVLKYVSD